ncbi:glucose 1-dehydrogenase [bacterium]|nr:glucose 1-dehydrogenase [bacterium]
MFNEKVAVITGGASGIGLATARKLLSEGAKVVLVDWNEDVSEIAKTLNNDALGIRCDVSSDTDVQKSVNDIIEKFGHIDFLVANAGIGGGPNKAHEVSVDEWNKVIGVNQTGIFLMNKYVISEMLKNGGGAIVNTSSMYGLVGTTMSFAYSASKGAINQMTRSLALTYARDNIRVNAVAPGYVDTPILAEVPKEAKDAMANQLPVGRLGKDTEIANLICYLLSDDASFITGAIVPIDGGFTAA